MSHDCHCQTGKRTLVLVAPELAARYAELVSFAETAKWEIDRARGCVRVPVSGCGQFTSVVEVVNFLRAIVDDARMGELRAAWVQPHLPTDRQLADALPRVQPLVAMAGADSSPLMSMLQERRIDTWFQPIFHAASLDLWGYECLMRGRDRDGKVVSPAQVIGWARQEQLVFMLDRVCRETHLINAGRVGLPGHAKILINFMPTSIYQPEYCLRTTMAAADRSGIDPKRIVFEVVESEEVVDRAHLARILDYYRAHGFKVALDDLGSGYAGLTLLADLNPDLIKIDRELIARATTSPMHRAVCEALVRIGRETGKLVLAEGVERVEELELMRRAGADLIQGFLLGKPHAVPATQPLITQRQAA